MKYLSRFLPPVKSEDMGVRGATKPTKPPAGPSNSDESLSRVRYETYKTDPDPLDTLQGPRRTPWNTLVWSDPDEPAIELFGPPPAASRTDGGPTR